MTYTGKLSGLTAEIIFTLLSYKLSLEIYPDSFSLTGTEWERFFEDFCPKYSFELLMDKKFKHLDYYKDNPSFKCVLEFQYWLKLKALRSPNHSDYCPYIEDEYYVNDPDIVQDPWGVDKAYWHKELEFNLSKVDLRLQEIAEKSYVVYNNINCLGLVIY